MDRDPSLGPVGIAVAETASILRLHIIGVAVAAALTFSWLLTGEFRPGLALVGAADWMLINLLNRITDLGEDLKNEIRGTERVAAHLRTFWLVWWAILLGSFGLSLWLFPEVTPLRLIVQAIGVGYSIAIVPTPRGLRRFKEIYFLKNFMSAVLFVHTVFLYALADAGWVIEHPGGWGAAAVLIVFFVSFELTYEILYDMRDLPGDSAEGIPTYPVVHGLERSRQIIDGLLIGATVVLASGLIAGLVGLREGLILAAPLVQFLYYRPRYRRGLEIRDCIQVTNLGTALLLFYVVGNAVWLSAGLPANVWF